jgi:FkbM family methyltransferase
VKTIADGIAGIARRITPLPLRRALSRLRGRTPEQELRKLRRRMYARPPITSGVEPCFGYRVRITDGRNFYMQYKEEFIYRLYHFNAARPDPLIIDGGSNMGMSILSFKKSYPAARVIGFEPDPNVFRLLEENVRENGLDLVTLVNAGLAATEGCMGFRPDGGSGGQCIAGQGAVTIRTVRLSDYLQEPVDFLKLDIEGLELDVLQEAAAAGRLSQVRELVLEYHGRPREPQRLGQILSLLDQEGFRYLVHDFADEAYYTSKPPFMLRDAPWYCLVYGKRVAQRAEPKEGGSP